MADNGLSLMNKPGVTSSANNQYYLPEGSKQYDINLTRLGVTDLQNPADLLAEYLQYNEKGANAISGAYLTPTGPAVRPDTGVDVTQYITDFENWVQKKRPSAVAYKEYNKRSLAQPGREATIIGTRKNWDTVIGNQAPVGQQGIAPPIGPNETIPGSIIGYSRSKTPRRI